MGGQGAQAQQGVRRQSRKEQLGSQGAYGRVWGEGREISYYLSFQLQTGFLFPTLPRQIPLCYTFLAPWSSP